MDKLFSYEESFILDNMNTWPVSLRGFLDDNLELFNNYFLGKSEIDRLEIEDPIYRVNIIENDYNDKYEYALDTINKILNKYYIIGFHCTNLIKCEKESIIKNGLRPLSKKLVDEKLEAVFKEGLILESEYMYLKDNNLANTDGRTNNVFCFHTLKILKEHPGLLDLLTIWGGESIYWDKADETLDRLLTIGDPSIVVLKIPYEDACYLHNLSEKIIDRFLNELDNNHYFSDVDNHFSFTLNVVDILTPKDEIFHVLTSFGEFANGD